MKKLKILFSMICAIAIISSLCVPAFAYSDGDREVLYYNFNIGTGRLLLVQHEASLQPRMGRNGE